MYWWHLKVSSVLAPTWQHTVQLLMKPAWYGKQLHKRRKRRKKEEGKGISNCPFSPQQKCLLIYCVVSFSAGNNRTKRPSIFLRFRCPRAEWQVNHYHLTIHLVFLTAADEENRWKVSLGSLLSVDEDSKIGCGVGSPRYFYIFRSCSFTHGANCRC